MVINFRVHERDELKPGKSVIQLYYGPGGAGKTYYGGECTLVISAGEGIETLLDRNYPHKPKIVFVRETFDPKTGIFKSATGFDEVTDALDWALEQEDIRSVCIDDATFLGMFAKNKSIEINDASGKSKSLETSKKSGFVSLNIQDYGEEIKIITWFLATYVPQFKSKEKDLVLLAHERHLMELIDPGRPNMGRQLKKILPGFTGETFPDQIQAFFDLVWHAESIISNGKFFPIARTKGDISRLITKTRGTLFEERVQEPRFSLVKKAIETQTPYKEILKQSGLGK